MATPILPLVTGEQAEFIDKLAAKGVFGRNADDVVRGLLDYAIRHMVESEYVRKHLEMMAALRGGRRK